MSYMTTCRAKLADGSRCEALTTNRRGFCDDHATFSSRLPSRPAPERRTYRWQKTARTFVRAWVREHGWLCVGHGRAAHYVAPPRKGERSPLHADHVTPLAKGGAAYDPRNLQALCASCNGRKAGHGGR